LKAARHGIGTERNSDRRGLPRFSVQLLLEPLHRLEVEAARQEVPPFAKDVSREELIRKANNAVRSLKAGERGAFEAAVQKAIVRITASPPIPEQTLALANLRWPLVLSTNYDNCYAAALHLQQDAPDRPLAVVGRGVEDCQRVLNSLSVAGRSLLWALQGYLDAPYVLPGSSDSSSLRQQLVVGHEEYRRVTYRDLHFRRAFAEVFRQRSLLFLGAGIQETYLQELFGEVLEYYGPSTRPHYAFIQKGEIDPDFMLARFQIIAVKYSIGEHSSVIKWLNEMARVVKSPRQVPMSWSWGRITRRGQDDWTSAPDLEVVRGPLPTQPLEHECLAVSAGGSGKAFFFSDGIRRTINEWGVATAAPPNLISNYVGEYPGRHVFAVRARSAGNERSLSHIYDASMDLFDRVTTRYRCIRMQLLAAGGTDKLGASSHRTIRTYPERFAFIQIVRAWAVWRNSHPDSDCRLALYVVLDAVYHDIISGRIDVLELLSCRDMRFFAEIVSDAGVLERRLFQMMPDTPLNEIVRQLQLSSEHWTVEVTPPPSLEAPATISLRDRLAETLQSLGVVPGSTLHFRRPQPHTSSE
jgi:hypothetical protein